jgi:hypothetical protein
MWTETRYDDMKELMVAIAKVLTRPNPKTMVFRGQADHFGWKLEPSIERDARIGIDDEARLAEERLIVKEFSERTKRFLGTIETDHLNSDDPINTAKIAVLQHYGAPTRLLDWSYSPFIALYFAAIHYPEKDGVVFTFEREAFNDAVDWDKFGMAKRRRAADGSMQIDVDHYAFRKDSPDWFCAIDYPRPFDRLKRQHGLFTIAGKLGVNHGDRIAQMIPTSVFKWVIPSHLKSEVLDHLEIMNTDYRSIGYEGADHVGRALTQQMRDFRKPSNFGANV